MSIHNKLIQKKKYYPKGRKDVDPETKLYFDPNFGKSPFGPKNGNFFGVSPEKDPYNTDEEEKENEEEGSLSEFIDLDDENDENDESYSDDKSDSDNESYSDDESDSDDENDSDDKSYSVAENDSVDERHHPNTIGITIDLTYFD